jgi:hypothetical protein
MTQVSKHQHSNVLEYHWITKSFICRSITLPRCTINIYCYRIRRINYVRKKQYPQVRENKKKLKYYASSIIPKFSRVFTVWHVFRFSLRRCWFKSRVSHRHHSIMFSVLPCQSSFCLLKKRAVRGICRGSILFLTNFVCIRTTVTSAHLMFMLIAV